MVGSTKRSNLYLGKQAESYKVMIYAPPCLEMTVAEGVVERKASPPRIIPRAQKKVILESKQRTCILLLRSNTIISKQANMAGLDMMHVSLIAWHGRNCKQV